MRKGKWRKGERRKAEGGKGRKGDRGRECDAVTVSKDTGGGRAEAETEGFVKF